MEVLHVAHLGCSCVKGYHVFRTGESGDTFYCAREPHNPQSEAAIVVKFDRDDHVIGHVPDRFATILALLLDGCIVTRITGTVTGPQRSAPDGIWTVGGGIELPCEYVLHGAKKHRSSVRTTLWLAVCKRKRSED